MYRTIAAILFTVLAVTAAQAHFPFIVPEGKGETARIVFSDELAPDTNVNIEKIANTKLFVRDSSGKETPAEWTKGEGFYTIKVSGAGDRTVYGTTDYGVLQKGDAKPFKLLYLPKAVIGAATAKTAIVGEKIPLEVVAVGGGGKARFLVLAVGKPAADLEVTVMLPDGTKKMVKTDRDGLTPEFEATGRFGVVAKAIETKTGEHGGKKYDEVRTYATLVCDTEK